MPHTSLFAHLDNLEFNEEFDHRLPRTGGESNELAVEFLEKEAEVANFEIQRADRYSRYGLGEGSGHSGKSQAII